MAKVSEEDEGKSVVNRNGDMVGIVSAVEEDRIYIDPNPGITDKIKSKLGWETIDEDDYAITERDIETVTGDEIRLNH